MADNHPDDRLLLLGQTIRRLRLEAGESQHIASHACGIRSRTYWTTLEHGQANVSMAKLLAIADHYGLTVSQMCAGMPARAKAHTPHDHTPHGEETSWAGGNE
ncbi:MAG: helix-turn-helix transcriptional regulator [Gordonia polyisoprenivorans]|nr:helix-turn-helix transcriptional regulator [Gordonia polyisoprenivorans]